MHNAQPPSYPYSHHQQTSYSHSHVNPSPSSPAPSSLRDMTVNPSPKDVSSTVHALLLSTRQLQDALTRWSTGLASEAEVSDVYVQIGTQFNETIHAFAGYGIDLSDIHSIPNELRTVLEQCLAEDPSPDVVNAFMPAVRRVLYKLLKGLQARQDAWKSINANENSHDAGSYR